MEVWNNRLLLSEGEWPEIGRAAESVRKILITKYVENGTIPATQGIAYWSSVPRSVSSASLLYLQHSPAWLLRGIIRAPSCGKYWKDVCTESCEQLPLKLRSIRELCHKSFSIKTYRWQEIPKKYAVAAGTFIVYYIRAFRSHYLNIAKSISEQNIVLASNARDLFTEAVGNLLLAGENTNLDKKEDVQIMIEKIAKAVNAKSNIETSRDALNTLQDLLDNHSPVFDFNSSNDVLRADVFPSVTIRWWPAILISIIAGRKLAGSWPDFVYWVQNSLVDTTKLFWKNWILDPFKQIYLTIRHDPSNQVALIAQESLKSDIDSLERMVVDFAQDTNSGLTQTDLKKIADAASRGNVTPVMSVYEKQLSTPITSLLTGKLIRTLLIQVQKSKVDLEVALSGIDRLLQSQQLVFGIVAAIPAMICGFWMLKLSASPLWSSHVRRGQLSQSAIAQCLMALDKTIQSAPSTLRALDLGLIYSNVHLIRLELDGHNGVSQLRLLQQLHYLEENAISQRNSSISLIDLDRAYSRYYMK